MTPATANQKPKGAQAPSETLPFNPELCAAFLLGKTPEQAGVYLLTFLKRHLGCDRFRWEAGWAVPSDLYVFNACFKEAKED